MPTLNRRPVRSGALKPQNTEGVVYRITDMDLNPSFDHTLVLNVLRQRGALTGPLELDKDDAAILAGEKPVWG